MATTTRILSAGLISAALALGASACGSSASSSSPAATTRAAAAVATPATATAAASRRATTLHLTASPTGMLRFNHGHLVAPAGRVTIMLTNPKSSGLPHGVGISGHGLQKVGAVVSPGHASTVTATLKRGTYTYFCPVPGHAKAGMTGTLTIT